MNYMNYMSSVSIWRPTDTGESHRNKANTVMHSKYGAKRAGYGYHLRDPHTARIR